MPFIRSSVFKRLAYYFKLVAVILSLSKIMPTYSYYMEKELMYIIIMALFGRQSSFYAKYTKLNICLFYNIYLVFNTKCIFFTCFYIF